MLERDVLAAAAIPSGGFDLALLAALLPGTDVLDPLDALISFGLVQRGVDELGPRFHVLQTIRTTVWRDQGLGERTALERHLAIHIAEVIRRTGNRLDRPDSCDARALSRERDNVRAALAWAVAFDGDLALELTARLGYYWIEVGAIDEGLYKAVSDPRKPSVAPEKKDAPPALNFAPLQNAVTALTDAAARYHKAAEAASAGLSNAPDVVKAVNARLIQSERELTDQNGLPGRTWYKHLLYAPGLETGYGVKTMPGAREGIEQGRYDEADREIGRIAAALERETTLINAASADLERVAH